MTTPAQEILDKAKQIQEMINKLEDSDPERHKNDITYAKSLCKQAEKIKQLGKPNMLPKEKAESKKAARKAINALNGIILGKEGAHPAP